MRKAIITGANGFIGSAIIKELINNDIEVIALDREGCNNNIPEGVKFYAHELTNSDELEEIIVERDIDIFYHLAWVGSAGELRTSPDIQLNNAKWTLDCINVAKKIGCKRFICAGTIMERETIAATLAPGNKPGLGYIYGSGKLVAHTMAMSVAANLGIDLIWAIITNAYGAGEISPRFVNTTIRKIIDKEPLVFTSGTQNYDFVYIDDVARAFRLIGEKGKPFNNYVIGSSTAKPLKEFLKEMQKAIANDMEFVFGNLPYSGVNLEIEEFDTQKTEKDTGFKAVIDFAEGVKLTKKWIEEQRLK